jgi:hypothetical protein
MFIPPTNDTNESLLGGGQVHACARSASTIAHFSASEAYHHNNTEAFANAKLDTEEDALYIMHLARVEDASGAMHKFCDELLQFKQKAAENSRAKQKAKADDMVARISELKTIPIVLDPPKLTKLTKAVLRKQLDIQCELLKESGIAKMKLGDMKNKPDILKEILASDERFACRTSETATLTDTVEFHSIRHRL